MDAEASFPYSQDYEDLDMGVLVVRLHFSKRLATDSPIGVRDMLADMAAKSVRRAVDERYVFKHDGIISECQ